MKQISFLLVIIFSFSTISITNAKVMRKTTSKTSKISRKDIYIAIRTDGKPGSGTPGDPFDFAFLFAATATGASNCWAKDCLFESPRGDYNAAIAMFGFDAANPLLRSGVIGCRALGRFDSGLLNLAHDSGITVTGCYTYDSRGVYHDTGTLDHLVVTNNVFDRVWGAGVQSIVNNHRVSDLLISDNYIQVVNNVVGGHSYGVMLTAQGVSKATITKNVFIKDATGSGYPGWRAIHAIKVNEAVIADNTGDKSMEYTNTGTKVSARNNRDFDGTPCVFSR